MNIEKREFYASSDGSRWYIARQPDLGHAFIQHIPGNPPSREASHIELDAFLNGGAKGPEHQAFLRLVGTLVQDPAHADRE
jgi:hypothetical protein